MTEKAAATQATNPGLRPTPATAVVERLARALAVVPSLGPTTKAWKRLGFSVSEPFEFMGCLAADVSLAETSLRFLAPSGDHRDSALAAVVDERLVLGSGLLGWSWACASVRSSREFIETRANRSFPMVAGGRKTVVVPSETTPGATTILEPDVGERGYAHRNCIERIDHLVLAVNETDAAADAYASHFGLHVACKTIADRRYAHVSFDGPTAASLEIAGPAEPSRNRAGGRVWGIAFRSADLDETVRALRAEGITLPEPYAALQGGRITGLPMSLGGINIAFVGA